MGAASAARMPLRESPSTDVADGGAPCRDIYAFSVPLRVGREELLTAAQALDEDRSPSARHPTPARSGGTVP